MLIKRDGKVYELTAAEMNQAYAEIHNDYMREDVKIWFEDNRDIEISDEEADKWVDYMKEAYNNSFDVVCEHFESAYEREMESQLEREQQKENASL